MLRLLLACAVAVAAFMITARLVHAEPANTPLRFEDGFAALSDMSGAMGSPTEAPHLDESGQTVQLTTTGLAYYDTDSNTPAFTDGSQRWALTELGVVRWKGTELLPPSWVLDAYRRPQATGSGPRDYLYRTYPRLAGVLDRIITCESGWDSQAASRISTARGLAQFLATTWATTPQAGRSPLDPIANIDAAAWLYSRNGAWPWLASRACHHLL